MISSQVRVYTSGQAGFEVEEQEAAEVLQNLSTSMQ